MKAPKQAGMNPVARAVAREKLKNALRDQKIALYMLTPGERCAELLAGVSGTLTIVLSAAQIDKLTGPDMAVLKGGLNACLRVMLADSYDTSQTVAIVTGLDKAMLLAGKVRPESVDQAWMRMQHE
jgi:hypothetical protein